MKPTQQQLLDAIEKVDALWVELDQLSLRAIDVYAELRSAIGNPVPPSELWLDLNESREEHRNRVNRTRQQRYRDRLKARRQHPPERLARPHP